MKICKCCGKSLLLEKLFIHDFCDKCWVDNQRCNVCLVLSNTGYGYYNKKCKKCNKNVCFGCTPFLHDDYILYRVEKICLVCFNKEYEVKCNGCNKGRVLSKDNHHIVGLGGFCCGCACESRTEHYYKGCVEDGGCEGFFVINDKKGNKNILLF